MLMLKLLLTRIRKRPSSCLLLLALLLIYYALTRYERRLDDSMNPICRLPQLKPFDPYVEPYLEHLEPLICPLEPPLSLVENGILKSVQDNCFYSWLWVSRGDIVHSSEPEALPRQGIPFKSHMFANVSCIKETSDTIYHNTHFSLPSYKNKLRNHEAVTKKSAAHIILPLN